MKNVCSNSCWSSGVGFRVRLLGWVPVQNKNPYFLTRTSLQKWEKCALLILIIPVQLCFISRVCLPYYSSPFLRLKQTSSVLFFISSYIFHSSWLDLVWFFISPIFCFLLSCSCIPFFSSPFLSFCFSVSTFLILIILVLPLFVVFFYQQMLVCASGFVFWHILLLFMFKGKSQIPVMEGL